MRRPDDHIVADDGALDGVTDLLVDARGRFDEEPVAPGRLQVMAIGKASFATVALPGPGSYLIGRNPDCAVRIDDNSISRRHALLHVGDDVEIEDLGSANGTHVRSRLIQPKERVRIALGEIVALGKTTIVVQQRSSIRRMPRRVWPHEDFEARLHEECARAERSNVPLAVLHVQTSNTPPHAVQETLAELLRQSDILGSYGPDTHEVLLPDTPLAHAEEVTRRLREALRQRGIECQITSAHFPQQGRSSYALMGRLAASTAKGSHLEIVVRDPVMQRLHALAKRIATSDIGALILGETGVGKDVLAERIHVASPRNGKSFLQLNCAGLTETMLDSELFGHEKGAFTGAVAAKAGLLESADGGTVFLDEIGDMPHATQAKLLRVLEDGKVRRVGGLKARPIDVRFIAATNRDIDADIAAGTFRRDLYFRLNGVTIVIPPLRERIAEIEPLARLFASRAAVQANLPLPVIAPEALELLRSYSWPGNVRELKNVISRAVILSTDGVIGLASLPIERLRTTLVTAEPGHAPSARGTPQPADSEVVLMRRPRRGAEEAAWIRQALEATRGNQSRAAKLLGISRRTLINRLAEYGFDRPRKG